MKCSKCGFQLERIIGEPVQDPDREEELYCSYDCEEDGLCLEDRDDATI